MTVVLALARRDLLVQRSYALPFVFDLVWGVVDLFVWYFVSRIVGPESAVDLQGAPTYFAFALAGVIGSLVVSTATSDIAWRVREDQVTGTLETIVTQPVRPWELAAGTAAFPFAYGIVRVALYLVLAVAFLDFGAADVDWLGVVVILGLSGTAFIGLGVLAAAIAVVLKRGAGIVGAVVFAMTFVSGAMFPISVLPGWLQAIGKAMPTRPAFEGLRDALFLGGGWGADAAALAGVTVVLVPAGVLLLGLALRIARRRGSLGQY